jgi:hypothetical protein
MEFDDKWFVESFQPDTGLEGEDVPPSQFRGCLTACIETRLPVPLAAGKAQRQVNSASVPPGAGIQGCDGPSVISFPGHRPSTSPLISLRPPRSSCVS